MKKENKSAEVTQGAATAQSTLNENDKIITNDNSPRLDTDELSIKPLKLKEMEKTNINVGTLYEYRILVAEGYKFARIKVNREIDTKNVNKKKASMKAFKGAIMPFLVVKAEDALNSNLTVVLDDGTEVTKDTEGLDKILVLLDGQHREAAIKKLLKEGEMEISAYVMLPLITSETRIESVLQEVNTLVNPWDGIDWLTSLVVKAKDLEIPVDAIEFVKELSGEPGISNSAASLWGTGQINSKAKIIRVIKSDDHETIKKLASDNFIDQRRTLYKTTKAKLGDKLVGLKNIPRLLCNFEEDLINESYPRPKSWEKVIDFVDTLNPETAKELKEAKKSDKQTKDQVITSILIAAWKKYKDKL